MTLYSVRTRCLKVIKRMLIKTLGIKVSFQWTFEDGHWPAMSCEGSRRAAIPGARACDSEGRPLLNVASPPR